MDKTNIKNIVLFKPSGAGFCHALAYKELAVEHLDEERFLNFEFRENRIASFDAEEQPALSVETEPITGTTSLSLRDNKPVVIINGRANLAEFAFFRTVVTYSTVPLASSYTEGLKVLFRPICLSRRDKSIVQRYNIIDEQKGTNLGVLLVPVNGSEMTLAFEEGATETQRRIIVGTSAFIISDAFRVKYLADATLVGVMLALLAIFMIALYFQ